MIHVHPSSVVDEGARIGGGTRIWHYVHVSAPCEIGVNCVLGQGVFVGRNVVIGNRVKVQNNVSIFEGVILEDDVFCGPSMVFTNVINPRSFIERKHEFRSTRVGRGASLGANCTVVCGVSIGEYAMVGAGAVVTHDVAPHALMVGVPARQLGWISREGDRIDLPIEGTAEARCASGVVYRLDGRRLVVSDE